MQKLTMQGLILMITQPSYMWGKIGRIWYPAVVVTKDDVPPDTLGKLGRKVDGKVFVRWVGEGRYTSLNEKCVELLARNKTDEYRANRSNYIIEMYHLAFSELIDD